jgi:hypothetical protein
VLTNSAMRRAPQLGQKPRRLQLNATSFSAWQLSQRAQKPVLEPPAFEIRLELLLHVAVGRKLRLPARGAPV